MKNNIIVGLINGLLLILLSILTNVGYLPLLMALGIGMISSPFLFENNEGGKRD